MSMWRPTAGAQGLRRVEFSEGLGYQGAPVPGSQ